MSVCVRYLYIICFLKIYHILWVVFIIWRQYFLPGQISFLFFCFTIRFTGIHNEVFLLMYQKLLYKNYKKIYFYQIIGFKEIYSVKCEKTPSSSFVSHMSLFSYHLSWKTSWEGKSKRKYLLKPTVEISKVPIDLFTGCKVKPKNAP